MKAETWYSARSLLHYSATPSLGQSTQRQRIRSKSSVLARVSLFENHIFIRRELAESLQERLLHFIAWKTWALRTPKWGSFFATKTGDTARGLPSLGFCFFLATSTTLAFDAALKFWCSTFKHACIVFIHSFQGYHQITAIDVVSASLLPKMFATQNKNFCFFRSIVWTEKGFLKVDPKMGVQKLGPKWGLRNAPR